MDFGDILKKQGVTPTGGQKNANPFVSTPTQKPTLETSLKASDTGYFSGLGARTAQEQVAGAQKIARSVKTGSEDVQKGMQMGGLKGGLKVAQGLAEGGFGTVTGAAQTALAPVTATVAPVAEKLFEKAKPALGTLIETTHPEIKALYDKASPIVKQKLDPVIQKAQDFMQKHPNATGLVGDILNTALLAVGGGEAEAPVKQSLTKEALTAGKETLQTVPAKLAEVGGSVKQGATKMAQSSEIKGWKMPTTSSKSTYSKANDIYASASKKYGDIAETLVNDGHKLSDNINIKNGTYDTGNTADRIIEQNGKMSSEMLRPSLQAADYYTPRTPVTDVFKNVKTQVLNNRYLTEADKETVLKNISKDQQLLAKKYPKGMSLTDMHDEKITYGSNVKRSPMGDVTTNLKAQSNEFLRDALAKGVEDKAPKDIGVHEFNQELTKRYKVADYLNAIDGKNVEKSLFGKIGTATGKLAGAALGEATGGGLLADVAGYHLGGTVANIIENMPNPVKSMLLKNLQTVNPPAFEAIKKYLGDQEVERLIRLQLPAPEPLGTVKNPIIPPAPTTYEKPAQVINREPTEQPKKIKGSIKEASGDSALINEARKYKSAEEFVKARTELTYKNLQENDYSIKQLGKNFDEPVEYFRAGDIRKNGDIWLTDNEAGAIQYSKAGGGTKVGSYIVESKKPLIIDTAGGKYANGNIDINKILTKDEIAQGYTNNPTTKQKFIDYAKKNGYDAVQFADSFPDGEGGMRSLVVWDKSKIKTKSQLTDIWKKANK